MKYFSIATLFFFLSAPLIAQVATAEVGVKVEVEDLSETYAETITSEDMSKILTVLASDEFEGRETGAPGLNKAADFIVGKLKSFGIKPVEKLGGYFQPVPFKKVSWGDVKLNINGEEFQHLRDFYAFASMNTNAEMFTTNEVVFLGYGIDDEKYSDYEGVDVKGKVIMIYRGEPKNGDDEYFLSEGKRSAWSKDWRKKLKVAKDKGVKTVLLIEPNTAKNINRFGNWLIEPSLQMIKGEEVKELPFANHVFISPAIAKTILGGKEKKLAKARKKISKKAAPISFSIPTEFSLQQAKNDEKIFSNNILGFIEGSDPKLKEEIVVITAHYDHLGRRGDDIFNGADDNGSGSTTILEMAQAYQKAKADGNGPRRSVLLMWVCGEEKGLLGSEYYVNNPVFDLKNTIVDVNVDMVGRTDDKHKDDPYYIYVIGSDRLSTELHEINEKANKTYTNLDMDYTYNAEDDPNRYYYRSDHYNFAERGIPSIFFFSGTHVDYHKATDTVEKINFEKMERIGRLIFHTSWELANRDKRIVVDVK